MNSNYLDVEVLYQQYYKDVYRYIYMMNYNSFHIDDIVQNTFEKALRGIKNFKGESSIKTWLFAIARNESIRYSQKNSLDIQQVTDICNSAEILIEDTICNKETVESILSVIAAYPEPKKSLLIFRLFENLSFVEIGSMINKSDTWCRVTFMRAKNEILSKIEGEING